MYKMIVPPTGTKYHLITERLGGGSVRTACGKERWNMLTSKTIEHKDFRVANSYSSDSPLCNNCAKRVIQKLETVEHF